MVRVVVSSGLIMADNTATNVADKSVCFQSRCSYRHTCHPAQFQSLAALVDEWRHVKTHSTSQKPFHHDFFFLCCLLSQSGLFYRDAGKSLAQPGRKQVNVSVRMAWISFGVLPCRKKKNLDGSSRLDVVEITRVPGMLPSLFPSWSG